MISRELRETKSEGMRPSGFIRARSPRRFSVSREASGIHPASIGVALYILVAVGRLQEIVPLLNGIPLGKVALILGFFGLLLARREASRPLRGVPLGKQLIALTVLAFFSIAVSVWKSHSLEFFIGTFAGNVLLFFLLVKTSVNESTRRLYTGALIVSAVLLTIPTLSINATERVEASTAYDANDLASVLVTILPLAIMAIFSGTRRVFWLLVALLLSAAVIATGSRGGFLGLLSVAFYLVWARFPGRKTGNAGRGKRMILLVMLAAVTAGLVGGAAWERITTLSNLENDYNVQSETGRLAVWKRGIGIMVERPWGVGIGAFEAAEGMEGGRYKAAHNSLLQVGAELGVVGLLVFISLCLGGYRLLGRYIDSHSTTDAAIKDVQLATALRAGLVGFFVTGFFLSHAYASVLYAFLGLAVAVVISGDAARATTAELPSERISKHDARIRIPRS